MRRVKAKDAWLRIEKCLFSHGGHGWGPVEGLTIYGFGSTGYGARGGSFTSIEKSLLSSLPRLLLFRLLTGRRRKNEAAIVKALQLESTGGDWAPCPVLKTVVQIIVGELILVQCSIWGGFRPPYRSHKKKQPRRVGWGIRKVNKRRPRGNKR